ncbi:DUF2510 domain-containing protein [Streptomyces poriticola]|uniref:DUF2510 domain-containing protein n=1 Tax=Streptomyces poriticola TaxID=3120506 RepID=UPI002FCE53EB
MTPPPGWYRDPSVPHQERWWDGRAWTEHRRAPAAAGQPPPPQPHPTVPLRTGGPAPFRGGTGRGRAVALTVSAAVLVAAVVGGALLLGRGDDGGTVADPPVTATVGTVPAPPSGPPAASPSGSGPDAEDPAVVEDQLNGITFPLPDGWVRPENVVEDDVMMTTDGTYECPGDGAVCRRGMVISRTVTVTDETSPEVLAKQDIADAADDAFHEDLIGNRPFGGLESHEVVKSGPVAVAGRAGYLVRWRVTTAKGPGGYVQSMVFPSSVGTGSPILVRYVFDAGEDGPPLAAMDTITEGIRPAGDADTGGGVGSSLGPTD